MNYKNLLKPVSVFLLALKVSASTLPPAPTNTAQDEAIWKKYCGSAARLSSEIPMPNYKDPEVLSAAKKLAKVSPFSFYFYSGPMYAYNLKSGKIINDAPASFPNIPEEVNGKKNAHSFLTLLCGEFRDRPSLIAAKLKWVNKMNYMPDKPQETIHVKNDLWSNVSARSYRNYITNSQAIFAAKEKFLKDNNQRAIMGKYNEDFPVEPFTVCETKFIFKRFVESNSVFGKSKAGSEIDAVGKIMTPAKRAVAAEAIKMTAEEIQTAYFKAADQYSDCIKSGKPQQECVSAYDTVMQPVYDAESLLADHGDDGEDGDFDEGGGANPLLKVKKTINNKEPHFRAYQDQYKNFKKQCTKDDVTHFYDFRGDSNFKPNSPESNGMIWFSSTIGNSCTRVQGKMVLKDKVKDKFKDPDICEKYFSSPFAYRWSAARAGLATWLLRDKKHDETYADSGSNVTVIPNDTPMVGPFAYQFREQEEKLQEFYSPVWKNAAGQPMKWNNNKEELLAGAELEEALAEDEAAKKDYEIYKTDFLEKQKNKQPIADITDLLPDWMNNRDKFWSKEDFGFNTVVQFTGDKNVGNKELAYERLRDAVNRHTDWYASAYDDGLGTYRDQAYSPFVASSYEMSASDGFTAPGTTVSSPADGCKHWMFVFKLSLDQWYNTKSIMEKKPMDFNKNWFDETSLGTNGLADGERALDRLGTALEGEMDSILYLHNINTSGQVNTNCGREAINATYSTTATPAVQ